MGHKGNTGYLTSARDKHGVALGLTAPVSSLGEVKFPGTENLSSLGPCPSPRSALPSSSGPSSRPLNSSWIGLVLNKM